MSKIYFIGGASGSGKSTILPHLKERLGQKIAVYDFDDIGIPDGADKKWRQESTEQWLQKLLKNNQDACLLGQIVLGEILACPSARQLRDVHYCLLDVSDFERINRLKKRGTYGADQNMLNWAAWLRMHHQDPQWVQHVLKDDCWSGLNFSQWDKLTEWPDTAGIKIIDTSDLSVLETTDAVSLWVQGENTQEKIPNTPYKLIKNDSDAYKMVDEKLYAYNKKCVPATQMPECITLNYVIKHDGQFIGGICADVYIWKILYVSVFFLDERYRKQGLGELLLQRVENEAKSVGAELVHLDTFDFQAKDFYLKQGYEIFGVLDDCPKGHQRFYLKKVLKDTTL